MRDLVTELRDMARGYAEIHAAEAQMLNGIPDKPMLCEVDAEVPVITVIAALAARGLTIYRAPYLNSIPVITTAERAAEFRRQVRESEAARDRENASGMEP